MQNIKKAAVNMAEYPRKEHFDYFRAMDYPYMGATVMLDITEFLERNRKLGRPFFLSFLWCAANAANSVPELRQRIEGEGIVEFSLCHTSHTEAKSDGTYAYCTLDCSLPIEKFIPYAKEKQTLARSSGSIAEDAEEALSLLFISCVPWLSYVSIVQPVPKPADSNPRITWGKYDMQNGSALIPVTILCNHAIVDGIHVSRFYERLQELLNEK